MQVALQSTSFPQVRPVLRSASSSAARRRSLLCALLFCAGALTIARPASADARDGVVAVDMRFLEDLESRAAQANPREQASLYADLADKITVLASQQISAGELDAAEHTLLHFESCAEKLKGGLLQNSKGLKKTELMLHLTQRRLQDMARQSSAEIRPQVQSAIKRMDSVETALLGVIFEK